jgi:hypothetical protein
LQQFKIRCDFKIKFESGKAIRKKKTQMKKL